MSIDLNDLSAEQIDQLRGLINGGINSFGLDALGRSPQKPRQLTDLTLPPTATDPRPTFFWSAEKSRYTDTARTTLYPRLMWSPSGVEVTVRDAKAEATHTAQGFVLLPPASIPAPDPVDEMADAMAALSEADRKALVASIQASRIQALQEKASLLTDEQLSALMAAADAVEPEKRGPGRPRKEATV
jgi:hypothetical protein